MRGLPIVAAALLFTSGAAAHPDAPHGPIPKEQVTAAVDAFFAALRSEDKTALARTMRSDGVIYIHDRRDPENPRIVTRLTADHLTGWEDSPQGTDEYMNYDTVLVDGDMALVWGPYVFLLNGEPTHCGINSMSLAKGEDGWRVSNTSFTMTALDECEPLGAPKGPEQ